MAMQYLPLMAWQMGESSDLPQEKSSYLCTVNVDTGVCITVRQ